MLPATFEKDDGQLRASKAVIVVLAIALLAAGFSGTGLLCFAVRKPQFQIESIFLPALVSCIIGLLTVLYDFLVFTRYEWDTGALLVTVAAAVSSIVYASLLVWSSRKTRSTRTRTSPIRSVPQNRASTPISLVPLTPKDSDNTLDSNYYNNYNRNMFPAAHPPAPQLAHNNGFDPHSVTEEEMQRQQMLMLLLQNHPPAASPNPATQGSSTYNIDWQGRDDEEAIPSNGFYAPPCSAFPQTAYPGPGGEIRPWDGVFRAPPRVSTSNHVRAKSQEYRDARRQEIERG